MSKVSYRLSFYEPDSKRECVDFDSETPFQAVHVGDEVVGGTWKNSAYPLDKKYELVPAAKITKVVRSLSTVGDTIYDITLAYTTRLPD